MAGINVGPPAGQWGTFIWCLTVFFFGLLFGCGFCIAANVVDFIGTFFHGRNPDPRHVGYLIELGRMMIA